MRKAFILSCCLLLTVACGKRQKAKTVLEDFLKENLVSTEFSLNITQVDSTRNVSDSTIQAMHKQAKQDKIFKKTIIYQPKEGKGQLILARVKLIQGTDTLLKTFYMDNQFKGVVAFKNY